MKALGSVVIYAGLYPEYAYSAVTSKAKAYLKQLKWSEELKAILELLLQGQESFADISVQLQELESLRAVPQHAQQSLDSSVVSEMSSVEVSRLSEDFPQAQDPRLQPAFVPPRTETDPRRVSQAAGTPFAQYQFAPSPPISNLLKDDEGDIDFSDPANSRLVDAIRKGLGLVAGQYASFDPGELPDESIRKL